MDYLLYVLLLLLVLEVFLIVLIKWLKRDFQWLITSEDELPVYNHLKLKEFINFGYCPELGWERKSNTSKKEPVKSPGEERKNYTISNFTINENKSRYNPGYEGLSNIISSYGDSFAFSRHANDDQTWQHYLSEMTNTNVTNFGVGNYGLDQALLRLKREFSKNKTDVVIMMVVPETITRIVNVWKHYSEYGNTFGFKGRFIIKDDNLQWMNNPINEPEKYKEIGKYLKQIKSNDYCYENKFRKDLMRFPYTWSFLRSYKRNIPLTSALLLRKTCKIFGLYNERIFNKPWELILKRNFEFSLFLYKNEEATDLLAKIIMEFKEYVEKHMSIPIFILAPYLHDLIYIVDKGHYYKGIVDTVKSKLHTIDLAKILLDKCDDLESLYVNKYYGAHFSARGNRYVAEQVYSVLQKEHLIRSACASGH